MMDLSVIRNRDGIYWIVNVFSSENVLVKYFLAKLQTFSTSTVEKVAWTSQTCTRSSFTESTASFPFFSWESFHQKTKTTFTFTGCGVFNLLGTNSNHSSFKVTSTLSHHNSHRFPSDNKPRTSLLELLLKSLPVCFSIGEFSKSFQESDVVWSGIVTLHSRSSRDEVNTHRNTEHRKWSRKCWYPIKQLL